jgi:hypothetical protein
MSTNQSRYDGRVQSTIGQALAGASIAVLTQPAVTTTQPGSPLAALFSATVSNTGTLTTASWSTLTQQLTFAFSGAVPADVIAGSYISISGVNPAGYNGIWQVVSVAGLNVVATTPVTLAPVANPGTYVSGGAFATSALPNPFLSDQLGNFFFYAAVGIYTVQIYDTQGRITNQLVLADQPVVPGGAGAGSVTSVGLALPAEFTVTGSPVTGSGTLTATKANENANTVWAGPTSGGAAAPAFRALVAADMPAGTGTVTSVAHTLAVPGSVFSATVGGSPITTSGTLADTLSLVTQLANTVWAGPSSGAASTPTFRSLVAQDLPNTTTPLTSANLLALQTTPITLVPAPGVGFAIVPTMIVIKFFGGTIAYTDAGGAVQFSAGSAIAALATNAIFLVTTSPNRRIQSFPWPGATDTAGNPPSDDNAALTINKLTNNLAAGNGTASILVWYYVVPTT